MEFRQLAYFVDVARLNNLTRAAERLKVAQPALSQQIKNLEQELGVKLFNRTGRGVALTEEGKIFFIGAEKTLAEAQRAKDSVKEFNNQPIGKVTIGALESVVQTRLPRMLATFRVKYPGIKVFIRENTTKLQLEALKKGELDLALGHEWDDKYYPQLEDSNFPSGIGAKSLYNDELVLTVAKGHPLEKYKAVSLRELRDEPFITFREGSGLRSLVYVACVREGFEPNITYECGSPRILVAEGLGFSIIPRLMAETPGPPISIIPFDPPLSRSVAVFFFEGRYLSPAADIFLRYAEKYLG